jgi:hypothetical protein
VKFCPSDGSGFLTSQYVKLASKSCFLYHQEAAHTKAETNAQLSETPWVASEDCSDTVVLILDTQNYHHKSLMVQKRRKGSQLPWRKMGRAVTAAELSQLCLMQRALKEA